MKSKSLFMPVLCFVCFSCNSVGIEEYMAFLSNPDNGLTQKEDRDGNAYIIQYRPIDLMLYYENNHTKKADRSRGERLKGLDYFLLQVNKKQGVQGEKKDFYYAYQFEKDLFQINNGDTIRPSIYLLEQGLGGGDQFNINVAFPDRNQDFTIYVNDRHGSKVQFDFSQLSIKALPELNI